MQQIFGQSVQGGDVAMISLGGYALGCLTMGYYLVKLRLGIDIREVGSGSAGARNVARVLGIPGFLVTLAADLAKGALAVWIARDFTHNERLTGLAMLAVVMGHIWPAQLAFRGGKGVATMIGALAIYDFQLGLAFGALFAGLVCLLARPTLAGLLAFTLLPMAAMFVEAGPFKPIVLSIVAGMILLAHRRNLVDEFADMAARRQLGNKSNNSAK
jgi:glycerol-3-phosphate acyltransferase PlsY